MNQKTWRFSVIVLGLLLSTVPASAAGWDFGLRGGIYNDASEAFVGAELLTKMGRSGRWFFNPNVEYVFVDNGKLMTFNADFHYDFNTGSSTYLWVGGGPALILRDPKRRDTETDGALNLLAGIGFKLRNSSVRPYLQGKLILADETESVIAFGIRF